MSYYRVSITIPASSVNSNLTDYPLFIDLSGAPAGFFGYLESQWGYDVQAYDSSGNILPFDLININSVLEDGCLFCKVSLSSTAATTIYLRFGQSEFSTKYAALDTYRQQVWSDYHRVLFFDADLDYRDHAKNVDISNEAGWYSIFENTLVKSEVYSHQGMKWDGTYWYFVDTNYFRKYDESWNLIASNSNPAADVGGGVLHFGDPVLYDGHLYISCDDSYAGSVHKIAKFTLDLTYVQSWDWPASYTCGVVGSELWCIPYVVSGDRPDLEVYDIETMTHIRTITLDSLYVNHLYRVQALFYWRERVWITSNTSGSDHKLFVGRLNEAGTILSFSTNCQRNFSAYGVIEGLCEYNGSLMVLFSAFGGTGQLWRYDTVQSHINSGVKFINKSDNYLSYASSIFTQWTVGLSLKLNSKGQNRCAFCYNDIISGSNSVLETLGYNLSRDGFISWNSSDLHLEDPLTPSTDTLYRLNLVHNSTAERILYRNSISTVDTGCAQRPLSPADGFVLGNVGPNNMNEYMDGYLSYFYLREGALTDDWIKAEYDNLSDPTSFYTWGDIEYIDDTVQNSKRILNIPIIGFKQETTPYTKETLTESDYKYSVNSGIEIIPDIENYRQRIHTGNFSKFPNITGKQSCVVNFSVDLYSLASTPSYIDLLESCGWKDLTLKLQNESKYNRVPSTIEVAFYEESATPRQIVYEISGSMGMVKISGKAGSPCRMDFSFLGVLERIYTRSNANLITPTTFDSDKPAALLNASTTLFGSQLYVSEFEVSCSSVLSIFTNINRRRGYDGARITGNSINGSMVINEDTETYNDIYDKINSNYTGDLTLQYSDLLIRFTEMQFNNIDYGENKLVFDVHKNISIEDVS